MTYPCSVHWLAARLGPPDGNGAAGFCLEWTQMKNRTTGFSVTALALGAAVLTILLAFGARTSPAEAHTQFLEATAGSVRLDLSSTAAGSAPVWTISFTNKNEIAIGPNHDVSTNHAIVLTFQGAKDFTNVINPRTDPTTPYLHTGMWTVDAGGKEMKASADWGGPTNLSLVLDDDDTAIPANSSVRITLPPYMIRLVDTVGATVAVTVGASGLTPDVQVRSNELTTVDGVSLEGVANRPADPGAAAQFQVEFETGHALAANTDTITLHFDKDIGGLGALSKDDVVISSTYVDVDNSANNETRPATNPTLDPVRRAITEATNQGHVEYAITLPDMDPAKDAVGGIKGGATVTVTVSSGAGLTNPTEAGSEDMVGVYTSKQTLLQTANITVPLRLSLSAYNGNRGKAVTVTGKGFKDGTTATVYLDKNGSKTRDTGDYDLTTATVAADDTFQAAIQVTVPPFAAGAGNRIGVIDGNGNAPADTVAFEVEGLATVSPKTLAHGDVLTIDVKDWPASDTYIDSVKIGGIEHLDDDGSGTVDADEREAVGNGSAQFPVTIGNAVRVGPQQIKVATTGGASDTANVTISAASLSAAPATAVPNRTLVLTGRGYTEGGAAKIVAGAGGKVTLAGAEIAKSYLNDGNDVSVDSGGNWTASLVIPVNGTTTPGPRQLKVVDSAGREGITAVIIMERSITASPATSRVGTHITITGAGFPASNNSSAADNVGAVTLKYGDDNVGSATPDASGAFAVTVRVPANAAIPSDNRVTATFTLPGGDAEVTTRTTHSIPAGSIVLSPAEVRAGENVTVTGAGFRSYSRVTKIEFGVVDVASGLKPSTDRNGAFSTAILTPDLEAGLYTIRVTVGGVTAHASVTIVEDTAAPAAADTTAQTAMAPADAFAALIGADNLLQAYHFDPATQTWSFYSPDPNLAALVDLTTVEPGQFYFVQAAEAQSGVTLGVNTVDIYAGWNPITW